MFVYGTALLLFSGCSMFGLTAHKTAVEEVVDICAPEQGSPFFYRKKVAVLAASLRNPQNAADLPELGVAWSESLQQRLTDSGRLLVVDASDQHLYSGEQQREWVVDLAKRLDVQFIIAVRFHNLHVSQTQFGVGSYSVALPKAQRQIDAELLIFDGYYGSKIASFSYNARATGSESEIVNPAQQPVLKGAFLGSPVGKAMISMLSSQVDDALDSVACLPLMERVLKVNGQHIHISANGASLIRPGEILQLFRRHGNLETQIGPIEIIRVFPASVIGVYTGEGDAPESNLGLNVRAW